MAKTRTLPDKYYDKDYETNGIHRVPLWRIAGFALNNTATNLYLMFMNYVSFYLLGFVGVGMVMASSFTMAMRIWDGVTDPFIGYMVDKTNGKFGKNRPFMVIGNIILAASSFIMFHFTHKLPEGPARFIFFVVFCCMDQIVQLLFNPNHQAPSPLVLAVLVALAVGMPPIMRYLAGKSNNDNTRGKK